MTRSPEAWRRLVFLSGGAGLFLAVLGYVALEEAAHAHRLPGLVAFYGGIALLIATVVLWYRHVPPREADPEGSDESGDASDPEWE